MLVTRVLTAAIGIPILFGFAYTGGYWWDALVVILAVLCNYELMRMADTKSKPIIILASLTCVLLVLMPIIKTMPIPPWAPLVGVVIIVGVLLKVNYRIDAIQLGWAFFSTLYVGFLFSYAIGINHLSQPSFMFLLTAFLLTWASDTGAFFVGKFFGKRQLSPNLSPNKTWEGSLGGVITTMLIAWALLAGQLGWSWALIFGLIASILAQMGDMFESLLKRYFGVKDSGRLLPGHGGVLDRFDSFLLVAPLVFYFLTT
ncbi:MAG: phosphatidate cytidylyltransferase [Methylocystaceae bacterium]